MKKPVFFAVLLSAVLFMVSCYGTLPSKGGGQLSYTTEQRKINPSDVLVPPGYIVQVITTGLTFPTSLSLDEEGVAYVIEAGYSYGEVFLKPKLLRVEADGATTTIYTGEKNGPWNGMTYHNGYFYIAEGGQLEGGKILKVNKDGIAETLVEDLPSFGDHHTNGPVVKDGYVYFGQGTATNSGVVGNDNAAYGWLPRNPHFHDIPCRDITVNAVNSETQDVLTDDPEDIAVTGPYSAYNQKVAQNQVIKGAVPCTGAVLRVPIIGGDVELVAWGFRNPYGLALAPNGTIFVTQNSYDVRGSRPIWGTADLLFELKEGSWYGWPDYNGDLPVTEMKVPNKKDPTRLLAKDPAPPEKPVAKLGVHSSSNGMDFSTDESFGFQGQAFIAQFGDMAPEVGKVISPVGFRIVRVNTETGIVEDFAENRGERNGPASLLQSGGLERPISVEFSPEGDALYLVDFGIMEMSEKGPKPITKTGVIWKVTKAD